MAERPKTSHKARASVHTVVGDKVQLPEEVSYPLVPTHNLSEFPDTENGLKDELDVAESSKETDESVGGPTKDLMTAFSDKVQNWEVKQSKPIDLFKKVKRPWSAVGKVQPAIEMTERPGSAPTSAIKPQLTSATIEEETSFINPVADDSSVERIQSPKAWPEPEVHGEGPVPDGIDFINRAAIESKAIVPTTDVIEEITRAPTPVRVAWDEQIKRDVGSRKSSTASVNSRKSTKTLDDLTALHPQAYVPYNVAKRNINRVISDMNLMREDHRRALIEVNRIYKEIEIETQTTFTEFVTELRQDYKDKVKAFTHIIDLCMKDNARKEEDWKLQAESLKDCNIKLVSEVNELIEYNQKQKDLLNKNNTKEITQLRQAMTEERRQLLLSLQAREETLRNQYESHIKYLEDRNRRKIDILMKQHQSNIQLREGVFASQIDAQAKEKEGIEGKMAEMAESHILEMKAKADEEEQRINELKEEERLRLEKLQKEKEDEINRISEERDKMEREWLAERDVIKEEFQTKIDGLNKTIEDSESQIKVHEDALAEYKTKVEEDMKEFEVQRKAEMERVKAAATEEEKKRIMEELEQNKRRTERKMRNSLANIQFHEAQKQTLLGKMDFAENQLREAEVEQEEAEAEVTHEKNRRLKEFKSVVEVKSAELEHIKSEHSAAMLESAEQKSTEHSEQTPPTLSPHDNKISTDSETIDLRNKLEHLTAELNSAKENARTAREELEQVREEIEKRLEDEKKNFEANSKSHESELQSKLNIITELRKQVTDLEAKTLADLPSDAQETIQTYKEKLVKLEQEVQSKDEVRNKLELSIELEKNKSVSLQDSVDRLNKTLIDTNSKLTQVKEEKENDNRALLMRCQEAEKRKLLASANSAEIIEFKNKVEQLQTELNSSKDEVKLVLEKMEKQKEESEKKFEDEKKLTEANTKSLQAELQSKQDIITELRGQISNLESEKLTDLPTDAQQTVQEYRDRLTALEQKFEENESIKNKLELSTELEKTKASSLQEDVERLNQSVSHLNDQLSEVREEKEKEVKTLLLRCQSAEKNVQVVDVPISSSTSANQIVIGLKNSVEQLKSELNNSKDEIKSVQEKMGKQKEESEKKLEDEKKLAEANTKSHQAELQSKQEIITELRKQVNDLEAKTLTDLPSDAQEIIQTYKEKLATLEQEIENKNEVKTKLELSIEVEKTKATSLQEDVGRLKQSLEDETSKLNRVKEEKENENKNLLIRCQEAEKSKLLAEETANKELIELRNNLEQLHTELNSNKGEIKLVLEKMEKQKEESEKKLEDEKKLTEANTKSLQADLQSKQDTIAELKKQISELEIKTISELPPDAQETIQSYKDRLDSLEKKFEETDETKIKLELAVELEKTKANSVQENNDRLNKNLADLNAKLESLKEEKEKEIKSLLTRCQEAEKSMQLEGSAISVAKIAMADASGSAVPTGEKVAVQDTEQSAYLTTENNQLSNQIKQLKQDVGSRNKAINSLKLQLREEKTKSDAFEKHLKMVLTESCEDEKQRKHNNKRLTAKQAELDAIRQQKDELERELEEWKVKAESQETFQSYVKAKEEELATLSTKEESFVKSVKALTLLYDGEISEDIIPASSSVLEDTVVDTDPIVVDSTVVDTTVVDTTVVDIAAVTRTVVEGSGEDGETVRHLNDQVSSLTEEIETLTEERDTLAEEKEAAEKEVIELKNNVEQLSSELTNSKKEADAAREEVEKVKTESEKKLEDEKKLTEANTKSHQAELQNKLDIISDLRNQVTDLEAEKLANLPPDAQETIQTYRDRLTLLEQEVEGTDDMKNKLELAVELEKTKAASLKESNDRLNLSLADMNSKLTNLQKEKENEVKALLTRCQESEKTKLLEEKSESSGDKNKIKQLTSEAKKLNAKLSKLEEDLELKTQQLKDTKVALKEAKQEAKKGGGPGPGGPGKRGAKPGAAGGASDAQVKALKDKNNDLKKQVEDSDNAIAELKKKLRAAETEAKKAAEAVKNNKDTKKLELTKKVLDEAKMKIGKLEEIKMELEKENERSRKEIAELQSSVKNLSVAAEEGEKLAQQCDEMKTELKSLRSENAELVENYNSERILRKKYYNIIEDMKGKIRVYCRARPLSGSEKERGNHSVILSPDEYTVQVQTKRGVKEFAYDQVFTPDTRGSQEHVFEDVKMLIQSAVDGYNVCIFAYGQTGSGKTFTMIGDSKGQLPGIAPRAYDEIFSLLQANEKKFSFAVSVYMVELYNDQLLDLFDKSHSAKLDIKKDKKGMVLIQNAVIKDVKSVAELQEVFDLGSKNRHVASTKMNAESSRSHLVIGIVIESTNLLTGAVLRGKLSLVDLAGSERAAKTGATPEQLKEAQSINKSLSALGDVIQALSSEANFIPYRNNKLTMLMQDSLGGNAKTLMFVNISPADYNVDETVVSLTYASRVKLITNDASKNADNKEIARLKGIISKLKKGESLDDDDEV